MKRCSACNIEVLSKSFRDHKNFCKQIDVKCKCGETVKRIDLENDRHICVYTQQQKFERIAKRLDLIEGVVFNKERSLTDALKGLEEKFADC